MTNIGKIELGKQISQDQIKKLQDDRMLIKYSNDLVKKIRRMSTEELLQKAFYTKNMDEIKMSTIEESLFRDGVPKFLLELGTQAEFIDIKKLASREKLNNGEVFAFLLLHARYKVIFARNETDKALQADTIEFLKMVLRETEIKEKIIKVKAKSDENGTYYHHTLLFISEDLKKSSGYTNENCKVFFDELGERIEDRFSSNIEKYLEFINLEECTTSKEAADEIISVVKSNSQYRINSENAMDEEQKEKIYFEELDKTLTNNADYYCCIDVYRLFESIAYRNIIDLALNARIYKDENSVVELEKVRALIDLLPKDTCFDFVLEDNYKYFTPEKLKQLKQMNIDVETKKITIDDLREIMQKIDKALIEQAKDVIKNNEEKLQEILPQYLSRVVLSEDDIIELSDKLQKDNFDYILKNVRSAFQVLRNMKNKKAELTDKKIDILMQAGMLSSQEIRDMYINGNIDKKLIEKVEQVTESNSITYGELISDYYRLIDIEDEDKEIEERHKLERKLEIFQLVNKDEYNDIIAQEGFEFISSITYEYSIGKNGYNKENIAELYELGLIDLVSIISLDPGLINYMYTTDFPEGKEVTAQTLLKLYKDGYATAGEIKLKQRVISGEIEIYEIDDIEELGLTKKEAQELLSRDILRPTDIFNLYYNEILTAGDLIAKLANLQTDEKKVAFIYGNFSDEKYGEIFNLLIQRLNVENEPSQKSENNATREIKGGHGTRGTGMPSKSRWKFNSTLDSNVCFKSLENGYILFYYPTSGKVEIEKMLDRYKGEIVDSYGTAGYGMDKNTFQGNKDQIIINNSVNRKKLMELAQNGLAEKFSHFSETWCKKKFEFICGDLPQADREQKKREIDPIVNDIKREIECARDK